MDGYYPILYEAGETAFNTLGLGYCECISCTVNEVMNCLEEYTCTMVYPVTGTLANEFKEGRVLLVLQDDTEAALTDRETFIIYDTFWDMTAGTITVYSMQEAVYRAKYIIVSAIPEAKETPAEQITRMLEHLAWTQYSYSDITVSASGFGTKKKTYPFRYALTLLDAIQGTENSLLSITGGELKCHRRNITLYKRRGEDNGAIVRYGKNLKSLTIETNASSSYDSIFAYWTRTDSETNEVTMITGDASTGGQIIYGDTCETAYHHPLIVDVTSELKAPDDWDTSESGEWTPSTADVHEAAEEKLEDQAPGTISVIYTAEIVPDPNDEPIEMGDTVLAQHPTAGINTKMEITSRTFDPLLRRHTALGIGSVEKSLKRAIRDLIK